MPKRVLKLKKGGVLTAPAMPESELMRKERLAHKKAVDEEITKNLKAHTMQMPPVRDDTDKLAHIKRTASIQTQTRPPIKINKSVETETETEPISKSLLKSEKAQVQSLRLKEVQAIRKKEGVSLKDAWALLKDK